MTRFRWWAALLMALVLVAAGCGGGDDGGSSSGDDEGGDAATETTEAEPEGQVLVDEDFDDDDNLWTPDFLDIEGEQDLNIDDGVFSMESLEDGYADLGDDEILIPNQSWPSVITDLADDLVDTRVTAEVSFEAPGVFGL